MPYTYILTSHAPRHKLWSSNSVQDSRTLVSSSQNSSTLVSSCHNYLSPLNCITLSTSLPNSLTLISHLPSSVHLYSNTVIQIISCKHIYNSKYLLPEVLWIHSDIWKCIPIKQFLQSVVGWEFWTCKSNRIWHTLTWRMTVGIATIHFCWFSIVVH